MPVDEGGAVGCVLWGFCLEGVAWDEGGAAEGPERAEEVVAFEGGVLPLDGLGRG